MKLKTDKRFAQADPYIFAEDGRYYLYVSAMKETTCHPDGHSGVALYTADRLDGEWTTYGVVCENPGKGDYWAPCIFKKDGRYYLYFSSEQDDDPNLRCLYVADSTSPFGPFGNFKKLYEPFSIDPHVVETEAGIFLFFSMDECEGEKIGTRVYVDRLLDPRTPAGQPKEVLTPSFDEEIFARDRFGDGRDWYTLEGAYWFAEGEWQYLMYSAGCFGDDTYHVGYAVAHTTEPDLTKVDFIKHDRGGKFDPVLIKKGAEEGTGHNSVLCDNGQYYIFYHGRDIPQAPDDTRVDRRDARYCRMTVADGVLTAEQ